jgi:glyoxylase-like metal-dependent hydrolase (beta-lactamase superfamily II)
MHGATTGQPSHKVLDLGDLRVHRVLEFERPLLAPDALLPGLDRATLERHRHWLEPHYYDALNDLLVLAFHSYVIETEDLVVLVDTCSGNDKERPQKQRYHRNTWPYLENLAAAGFSPEDIDLVCCTHLHADHVGWNTRLADGHWVPTFPNARYLFTAKEWAHWQRSDAREAYTSDPFYEDSLLPIVATGRADLVAMDNVIGPRVRLVPAPGHTPGHVTVALAGRHQHAVCSGDIMHHALQCAEPQYSSCFCVDPVASERTRRTFLDEVAETGTLVLPAHFPTPTAGTVARRGTAFAYQSCDVL